jgi:succinate dehydrogenase / fumarate reductase cytochrome b subunit
MAQILHAPRPYQSGRLARIIDGLRYGGGIGQWSWLAHRLSGLGILFFLVIHITDTFFVVFAPDWYDHTVAIYGGVWFNGQYYWPLRWAFRVAELGLIASVVFHAVNGVGVILYDLWPRGSLYKKPITYGVQAIFWTIMLICTPIVLYPLLKAPADQAERPSAASSKVIEMPTNPQLR